MGSLFDVNVDVMYSTIQSQKINYYMNVMLVVIGGEVNKYARVAQLAEALVLGTNCCGFESHPSYSEIV